MTNLYINTIFFGINLSFKIQKISFLLIDKKSLFLSIFFDFFNICLLKKLILNNLIKILKNNFSTKKLKYHKSKINNKRLRQFLF